MFHGKALGVQVLLQEGLRTQSFCVSLPNVIRSAFGCQKALLALSRSNLYSESLLFDIFFPFISTFGLYDT